MYFIYLPIDFAWPQLDFGWCLADVLKKNEENSEESDKNKDSEKNGNDENDKTSRDSSEDPESGNKDDGLEIGTWSNDMAINPPTPPPVEIDQVSHQRGIFFSRSVSF